MVEGGTARERKWFQRITDGSCTGWSHADEVAAATTAAMAAQLPNARVQTFAGAGASMIDDWEYFLEVVDDFLLGVESAAPPTG